MPPAPTPPPPPKPTPGARKPGVVGMVFKFIEDAASKHKLKSTVADFQKQKVAEILLKYDEVGAHKTIESLKAIGLTGKEITDHFDKAIEKVHAFRSAAQTAGATMGFIVTSTVSLDNHMETLNKHFIPINNSFRELTNTAVNMRNAVGQGVSTESMVNVIAQSAKYLNPEQKEMLVGGKNKNAAEGLESVAKGSQSIARVLGGELGGDEQALGAVTEMMVKYQTHADISAQSTEKFGKALSNIQKNSALSAEAFLQLNSKIADQAKGLGLSGKEAEEYSLKMNEVAAAASKVGLSLEAVVGAGSDVSQMKMGDFGGLHQRMQKNMLLGLGAGETDLTKIADARQSRARETFSQLGVKNEEDLRKRLKEDTSGSFQTELSGLAKARGLEGATEEEMVKLAFGAKGETIADHEKGIKKAEEKAVDEKNPQQQNLDSFGRKLKEINEKVLSETARAFQDINSQLSKLTGYLDKIVGTVFGTGSKSGFFGGKGGLLTAAGVSVGTGVVAGGYALLKGRALAKGLPKLIDWGKGKLFPEAAAAEKAAAAAAGQAAGTSVGKMGGLQTALEAAQQAHKAAPNAATAANVSTIENQIAKELETVKAGTAPSALKTGSKNALALLKAASKTKTGKVAGVALAAYGAYKVGSWMFGKKEGEEEEDGVPEEDQTDEQKWRKAERERDQVRPKGGTEEVKPKPKKSAAVWTLPGEQPVHAAEEFTPEERAKFVKMETEVSPDSKLAKSADKAEAISSKLNSIPMMVAALAGPAILKKIAPGIVGKIAESGAAKNVNKFAGGGGVVGSIFGLGAVASLSANILDTSKKTYSGDSSALMKDEAAKAEDSFVGKAFANKFAGGDKTSMAYGAGAAVGTMASPLVTALMTRDPKAAALAVPEMGFNAAKLVSASAEASRVANVEGANFEAQNKRALVVQTLGREFRSSRDTYEKVKELGDPGKIKEAHVEMLSKQLAWQQQNRQLSKAESTKAELKKAGVSDAAIASISEASKKRLYSDGTKEGFIAAMKELQTSESSNTAAQAGSKGILGKVRAFFGPGAAEKPENFVMPGKEGGSATDRIRTTDRKVADTPATAKVKETVVDASKKAGIDPRLGLAIVERESGFNVNAQNKTSSAGGAWQTIDKTANALGIKNKFDIGEQSEKSTKELAKYVKYFESHPEKMAEYNAKNRTQLNPSGMAMAAWHDGMPATLAGGRQDLEAVNYRNAAQRKTADIGRNEYASAGSAVGQAVPDSAPAPVLKAAEQAGPTSLKPVPQNAGTASIAPAVVKVPDKPIAIPESVKATTMESPSLEKQLQQTNALLQQLLAAQKASQQHPMIPTKPNSPMYATTSNNLGSR